jgi:hypothetical protein
VGCSRPPEAGGGLTPALNPRRVGAPVEWDEGPSMTRRGWWRGAYRFARIEPRGPVEQTDELIVHTEDDHVVGVPEWAIRWREEHE